MAVVQTDITFKKIGESICDALSKKPEPEKTKALLKLLKSFSIFGKRMNAAKNPAELKVAQESIATLKEQAKDEKLKDILPKIDETITALETTLKGGWTASLQSDYAEFERISTLQSSFHIGANSLKLNMYGRGAIERKERMDEIVALALLRKRVPTALNDIKTLQVQIKDQTLKDELKGHEGRLNDEWEKFQHIQDPNDSHVRSISVIYDEVNKAIKRAQQKHIAELREAGAHEGTLNLITAVAGEQADLRKAFEVGEQKRDAEHAQIVQQLQHFEIINDSLQEANAEHALKFDLINPNKVQALETQLNEKTAELKRQEEELKRQADLITAQQRAFDDQRNAFTQMLANMQRAMEEQRKKDMEEAAERERLQREQFQADLKALTDRVQALEVGNARQDRDIQALQNQRVLDAAAAAADHGTLDNQAGQLANLQAQLAATYAAQGIINAGVQGNINGLNGRIVAVEAGADFEQRVLTIVRGAQRGNYRRPRP